MVGYMASLPVILGALAAASVIVTVWALWVMAHARTRSAELERVLAVIDGVARESLTDIASTPTRDDTAQTKLRAALRANVQSIRVMVAIHLGTSEQFADRNITMLVERRLVWTQFELWDIEASPEVPEVWVVTPDLEPDRSGTPQGRLVSANLKKGKRYVYYYPADLPDEQAQVERLMNNISDTRGRRNVENVRMVPLPREEYGDLFSAGNSMLYFLDAERAQPPQLFKEISAISDRAQFWSPRSEQEAIALRNRLSDYAPRIGGESRAKS